MYSENSLTQIRTIPETIKEITNKLKKKKVQINNGWNFQPVKYEHLIYFKQNNMLPVLDRFHRVKTAYGFLYENNFSHK